MVRGFKKSAQAGESRICWFRLYAISKANAIYQAVYWSRVGILFLNQLKLDYFLLLTENAVNCQSGKNESTHLGLKEVHREVLSDI